MASRSRPRNVTMNRDAPGSIEHRVIVGQAQDPISGSRQRLRMLRMSSHLQRRPVMRPTFRLRQRAFQIAKEDVGVRQYVADLLERVQRRTAPKPAVRAKPDT